MCFSILSPRWKFTSSHRLGLLQRNMEISAVNSTHRSFGGQKSILDTAVVIIPVTRITRMHLLHYAFQRTQITAADHIAAEMQTFGS